MPKNLLLADDSKTIQQAVSMTFAREDVKLVTVEDGEAALQAAKAARPDLILADVSMPKLGGYELCQRVRADSAIKDVPVLLLGGGTPIDPAKAMAVGANGHMPKPFDSGKLIEQVKQILANPRVAATKPQAAAATRPPAPVPARPPQAPSAAGSTMTMSRPPAPPPAPRPGMAPPAASRPPAPAAARPAASGAPPPARPSAPPTARPPVPPGAASRPPASGVPGARPSMPPAAAAKPPPPLARPPAARPPPPPAVEAEDDIEVADEEILDESPAPVPTPLRAVPAAAKPALSVVPSGGRAAASDGGEAMLREALSKASREVIEKIAWEVVPELAETIIREELERLIKERGA